MSTLNIKAESHIRNVEGWISRITMSILGTKVESEVTIDNYLDQGVDARVRRSLQQRSGPRA